MPLIRFPLIPSLLRVFIRNKYRSMSDASLPLDNVIDFYFIKGLIHINC